GRRHEHGRRPDERVRSWSSWWVRPPRSRRRCVMARRPTKRVQGPSALPRELLRRAEAVAEAWPTSGSRQRAADLQAAVDAGDDIVLDTSTLGAALHHIGSPLAKNFRFASDPAGKRRWLLDEDDVIVETISPEHHADAEADRMTRVAAVRDRYTGGAEKS